MMQTWMTDKKKTDAHLALAIRIAGAAAGRVASYEDDARNATDFHIDGAAYAFRLRDHEFLGRFRYEFTLRKSRPSGAESEIEKILGGKATRLFYAFKTPAGIDFALWWIADLWALRRHVWRCVLDGRDVGKTITNPADGVAFCAFDVREIPGFVLASGGTECRRAGAVDGKGVANDPIS